MKFEKVSKEAFIKDCEKWLGYDLSNTYVVENLNKAYDNITLPTRSTSGSAGYDFKNPFLLSFSLSASNLAIPTGIRVFLDNDKLLQITPRSSASKKQLMLANTVGIIDSDYVNADNEGDIIIVLRNYSILNFAVIEPNEKIAQGIIIPFYTVDDDNANGDRTGGFGSTGK